MKSHCEDEMSLGQVAYEAYGATWLELTGYYAPAWDNISEAAQASWEAAAKAAVERAEQE